MYQTSLFKKIAEKVFVLLSMFTFWRLF